jgi:hypothetical protein
MRMEQIYTRHAIYTIKRSRVIRCALQCFLNMYIFSNDKFFVLSLKGGSISRRKRKKTIWINTRFNPQVSTMPSMLQSRALTPHRRQRSPCPCPFPTTSPRMISPLAQPGHEYECWALPGAHYHEAVFHKEPSFSRMIPQVPRQPPSGPRHTLRQLVIAG